MKRLTRAAFTVLGLVFLFESGTWFETGQNSSTFVLYAITGFAFSVIAVAT